MKNTCQKRGADRTRKAKGAEPPALPSCVVRSSTSSLWPHSHHRSALGVGSPVAAFISPYRRVTSSVGVAGRSSPRRHLVSSLCPRPGFHVMVGLATPALARPRRLGGLHNHIGLPTSWLGSAPSRWAVFVVVRCYALPLGPFLVDLALHLDIGPPWGLLGVPRRC